MNADSFYKKLNFKPYPHQKEAFERIISLADNGGYVIIKAPTASGKTEAAVAPYFAGLFEDYPFAKLIYVLPTKALVNAQKRRIEEDISKKLGLNLRIVVDHGNVYDKPMLNGDVVVCTLDTFIYGYASLRTFGRRLHYPTSSIASSLVVFDEVQMFQDKEYYTPRIIAKIFRYLYNSKIPFVVMTATLPKKLEEILFEDIKTKGNKPIVCKTSKRGKVKVEYSNSQLMESIEDFSDELLKSKKVGIILNTVPKAQEVYKKVKSVVNDEKEVILLHSRIKTKEREKREEKLKESEEFIVVATQVIEAGLDISLDFMLTELAPADAIIQRIGRVARRENESGNAFVFNVDSERPYTEEIINRTRNLTDKIGDCLNNLDNIQNIVNEVYDNIEVLENPLILQAELYFDELRLFSLPPEYELRVRPELYTTLFVPPKDAVDTIKREAEEKDTKKKTDIKKLNFKIKNNSFNVSYSWLRNRENVLIRINGKYICIDEFKKDEKTKILGFNTANLSPYRIFVLNPEYYDEELGMVIEK